MAEIVAEFLQWVELVVTFAARFETPIKKDAFYQGIILGILFNQIEIDIKEKMVTGAGKDGKV